MKTDVKHIVITGALGSLGDAMVKWFLQAGYVVSAVDQKEVEPEKMDTRVNYLAVNLTDLERLDAIFNDFFAGKSEISAWVNNAGIIHSELLINLMNRDQPLHSLEMWHKTLNANLNSVFYCSRWVADYFLSRRLKGVLVNVSSISAGGNMGQSAYSASKAGVESLTKVWAKELGRFNIRVNAIAPGFIDTPSTYAAMNDQKPQKLKKETPLGRLGTTNEISHAVQFLVENTFVNGLILGVDGGLTLHS